MFLIILHLVTGIFYGLIWYFIQMRGSFYLNSLFQAYMNPRNNIGKAKLLVIASTILSTILGGVFLVTVIFLKSYVGEWKSFLSSWVIGLCIGVFIIRKSTEKK